MFHTGLRSRVLLLPAILVVFVVHVPAAATDPTTVAELETALCGGATVKLDGHITEPSAVLTVAGGCKATLDLNGHTLTVARVVVDAGADLTIRDSSTSAGGKLIAEGKEDNEAGIRTTGATLRIESGTVSATGGVRGAGIGGGDGGSGGTVTVSGGTVTATGGGSGAGIGGGSKGSGGTVIVSGGTVGATGGSFGAAGIGGGSKGSGGTVTVSGGTVTATGGGNGAGIGGGIFSAGGTITVSGGTVTATGGELGAGIGGGDRGSSGGTITILGGTVTATGGELGAGIGGGLDGSGGTITISGGTVTATGGRDGAGIGGGVFGSGGTITVSGGTVTANGGSDGAGIGGGGSFSVTLSGGSGGTITVSGGTVTATSGFTPDWYGIGPGSGGTAGVVTIGDGLVRADTEPVVGRRRTTLTPVPVPVPVPVPAAASGLVLSCAPSVPVVGGLVTCTVTGGDAGIEILWRAAYNPVFAEAGVTLDAGGTGTFSFVVPRAALGEPLMVELVEWTAPVSIGVAGGPVPGAVPAGDGPSSPAGRVVLLLVLVGLTVVVVVRRVVGMTA